MTSRFRAYMGDTGERPATPSSARWRDETDRGLLTWRLRDLVRQVQAYGEHKLTTHRELARRRGDRHLPLTLDRRDAQDIGEGEPGPPAPPRVEPVDGAAELTTIEHSAPASRRAESIPRLQTASGMQRGHDERGPWLIFTVGGVSQRLRWMPAGSFTMGSPADEPGCFARETPHAVTLTRGFWIADTPCTQALWRAVTGARSERWKHDGRHPRTEISWRDGHEFLAQLNARVPELNARMPTEAEWEYACRAGSPDRRHGTPAEDACHAGSGHHGARAVASAPPSKHGLFDMLGNIAEWCADVYAAYAEGPARDPAGPRAGARRVTRGGSWYLPARTCRAAYRAGAVVEARLDDLGLRLVCDATAPPDAS